MRLRQVVREHIHRGHVEIQVNAEPRTAATIQVNQELVKAYMRAAEALRQETRAAADVDVVALLRLPGVISGSGVAAPENEESQEQLGRRWKIACATRWRSWTTCAARKARIWSKN